jgi:hypothetical protein
MILHDTKLSKPENQNGTCLNFSGTILRSYPTKIMPEDYLMRMIEQTTQMLLSILAAKKAGRNDDAASEIETACSQRIGLPLALVKRSSPEALSDLMQRGGGRYVRGVLLAELLLQDAELCELAGKTADAIRSQLQAFCLLAESIDVLSPEDHIVYRAKLDALAQKLDEASCDPYLREKLSNYAIQRNVRR